MNSVCKAISRASRRALAPAVSSFSPSYSTKTVKRRTSSVPKTAAPPSPPLPPAMAVEVSRAIEEAELEGVEMVFDRPRPSEIHYQPKVVNSVNLIGTVQSPVRIYTFPDGKKLAATFMYQEKTSDLPYLGIPIIFEGDLAHTAACHLKEKDNIYISGRLSADPLPVTVGDGQANVQVMVQNINFVSGSPDVKKNYSTNEQERSLDSVKKANSAAANNLSTWEDFINDPKQWKDYRVDKRNGSVKPKYPDFKHKEDGRALWISSAPKGILPRLEGLGFDVQVTQTKESKDHNNYQVYKVQESAGRKGSSRSFDESWKDLIENPNKWWDNRSNKFSEKSPDFKRKDDEKGLWLNTAPEWARAKLPPPKSDKASTTRGRLSRAA